MDRVIKSLEGQIRKAKKRIDNIKSDRKRVASELDEIDSIIIYKQDCIQQLNKAIRILTENSGEAPE